MMSKSVRQNIDDDCLLTTSHGGSGGIELDATKYG